jgi:hypothetical protein
MSELLSGQISGRRESSGQPLTSAEQEQIVSAKLRAAARKHFRELDLRPVHGGLLADERGDLFEPLPGTVVSLSGQLLLDRRDVDGFFLPIMGDVPLFVRAVTKGPRTVAELERERDRQRKQRQKAQHDRLKALERMPKRPVLAAELLGVDPALTLRSAAYRIVEAGGQLNATRSGELEILLPERARHRAELMPACKLLFAARENVLAALKTKKGVDGLPPSPLRGGEA